VIARPAGPATTASAKQTELKRNKMKMMNPHIKLGWMTFLAITLVAATPSVKAAYQDLGLVGSWSVINRYGGWNNWTAKLRGWIDQCNTIHNNSGDDTQWYLTGFYGDSTIPAGQTGGTVLNMLTSGWEGKGIRDWGRLNFDDLVHMHVPTTDTGGLTWQPGMYGLEDDDYFDTSYDWLHEIGHSCNGDHDNGLCFSDATSPMKWSYCGWNCLWMYTRPGATYNGQSYGDGNHNNSGRIYNQRWEVANRRQRSGSFWGSGNDSRFIPQNANWKALDVPGRTENWGTQLNIWDWNGTEAQIFYPEDTGNGWYKFKLSYNGGLVIDVYHGSPDSGTPVQIWGDNGSWAQRWAIQDWGNGYKLIPGTQGGVVMDVQWSGTANGSKIQLWQDNGSLAQRWRFDKCQK
jgi:Ricin-type beta-trefoil lectin domain-like